MFEFWNSRNRSQHQLKEMFLNIMFFQGFTTYSKNLTHYKRGSMQRGSNTATLGSLFQMNLYPTEVLLFISEEILNHIGLKISFLL